jgi:hypothetical protein
MERPQVVDGVVKSDCTSMDRSGRPWMVGEMDVSWAVGRLVGSSRSWVKDGTVDSQYMWVMAMLVDHGGWSCLSEYGRHF